MLFPTSRLVAQKRIAVIGSGIAGMSAAWLLSQRHRVTLYEKNARLGGHSNTVMVNTDLGPTPVDTGFIVFNELTYPNLTALLGHLGVASKDSDMSFGVSLNGGRTEYSSNDAASFLCGGRNLLSPRFLAMTWDLLRFYRDAPMELSNTRGELMSLRAYLQRRGYGEAFQRDHLLPQAAAIWSASVADIRDYPACAFVRFFENHGLLKLQGRPKWRTVEGGSRAYVRALSSSFSQHIRVGDGAVSVKRTGASAAVRGGDGDIRHYDDVIIATHADEALALLTDASAEERALLGAFRYTTNRAVLHTDRALMPKRKALWASWNYVGARADAGGAVTYWMNKLQRLERDTQIFLTLNPRISPRDDTVLYETEYEHPLFDANAIAAQERLWSLQGVRNTWFCGAHFGAGFHEDGLQAGLAVAEQLGGVKRPWRVENESGRIHVTPTPALEALAA
jgi:predicted NAD/FAD-binding protein